jgi:hypothetical protein
MSAQDRIDFTNITGADNATADSYLASWNLEVREKIHPHVYFYTSQPI